MEDAIVVLHRQQGGEANIFNNGIRMHSLFSLSELLGILQEVGRIDDKVVENVAKYISETQVKAKGNVNFNNLLQIDRLKRN